MECGHNTKALNLLCCLVKAADTCWGWRPGCVEDNRVVITLSTVPRLVTGAHRPATAQVPARAAQPRARAARRASVVAAPSHRAHRSCALALRARCYRTLILEKNTRWQRNWSFKVWYLVFPCLEQTPVMCSAATRWVWCDVWPSLWIISQLGLGWPWRTRSPLICRVRIYSIPELTQHRAGETRA